MFPVTRQSKQRILGMLVKVLPIRQAVRLQAAAWGFLWRFRAQQAMRDGQLAARGTLQCLVWDICTLPNACPHLSAGCGFFRMVLLPVSCSAARSF